MNGSKDDKEIIVLLKENQLYLYVTSFKVGFVTKKKKVQANVTFIPIT